MDIRSTIIFIFLIVACICLIAKISNLFFRIAAVIVIIALITGSTVDFSVMLDAFISGCQTIFNGILQAFS